MSTNYESFIINLKRKELTESASMIWVSVEVEVVGQARMICFSNISRFDEFHV